MTDNNTAPEPGGNSIVLITGSAKSSALMAALIRKVAEENQGGIVAYSAPVEIVGEN